MNKSDSDSNVKTCESTDAVLAEFTALRNEIQERTRLQQQIKHLAIIIAGTVITFGLQQNEMSILLVLPILILFLYIGYADHSCHIARIGHYIKNEIGRKLSDLRWEEWLASGKAQPSIGSGGAMAILSTKGIFMIIEIFPVVIALVKLAPSKNTPISAVIYQLDFIDKVLLIIDIFVIIITWFVHKHRRVNGNLPELTKDSSCD